MFSQASPTDTLRHLNLVSRVLSYLFRLSLTRLSASSIFSVPWQILPAGVALAKTPMLTQFLVEQIEFALVRPRLAQLSSASE